MLPIFSPLRLPAVLLAVLIGTSSSAVAGPFDGEVFRGRIAWSADGNHNDPDDWIASPLALAIFARAGLQTRVVHFDFNSILTQTDEEYERLHAEGVWGAAERYGYDRSRFFDCRQDQEAAVADIARAVNASSADNPLWFITAGPVEVPLLGFAKADPAKLPFVYCISHSRWNDGFAPQYTFSSNKRRVISQGVQWIQIRDQNRLLSTSPYGRPPTEDEWRPYYWLRESGQEPNRWLWERMQVAGRPDPSDAGMAWFLVTGDERCDPEKLRRFLDARESPQRIDTRRQIRLEAENFRNLDGFEVEDRNDRGASQRLQVVLAASDQGQIRTHFQEPFAPERGVCTIEVRYFEDVSLSRFTLLVNGTPQETSWESQANGAGWVSHTIAGVPIAMGDEITVDVQGELARLDYVQLNFRADR